MTKTTDFVIRIFKKGTLTAIILLMASLTCLYSNSVVFTDSIYGSDAAPTVASITTEGIATGSEITEILVTTTFGSVNYINNWYQIHLNINGTDYNNVGWLTAASYGDLNNLGPNGLTVTATTEDLDDYADSSTLVLTVEVVYNPSAGTPETPNLVSPLLGEENVPINTNLEWTTGVNTDHAVLYFAENEAFTDATIVNPATSPYSTSFASGTNYFWKVVALSSTGVEVSSAVNNFTTRYDAISTFPWNETFEDDDLDWIIIDNNNDGDKWMTNTTGYAYEGTQSVSIHTDFNAGNNDDYLITPQLTLTGNERLRFWYSIRNSSDPNDFEVLLSTTGVEPTDFSEVLLPNAIYSNTAYQEKIIDLSSYSGNSYIAFHIPAEGVDGYYLYIDDVIIEEIPTSANLEFSPEAVDFGSLMQSSLTEPQIITITNTGGVSTEILSAYIQNTNYFSLNSEIICPFVLEPQIPITVEVIPLTNEIGEHSTRLIFLEGNSIIPVTLIRHELDVTVNILDYTGNDHNAPFVLTLADQIITEHSTTPYNVSYNFCSSQSVVYKLTLPTSKLMDISLEGTLWDTKLYVFNSFDQIDTANQSSDAWYYNDDEGSAGTGGRFIEETKTRDRAAWSKMNQSLALAGDYYIIVTGYNTNNGEFIMTINTENIPAPGVASNPSPADEAENQPTNLTLTWDNAVYTETIDIYFGNAGSMVLVEEDIPAVEEYAVTLETAREYEWAIVNRNYTGETVDILVTTWSFSTTGEAPAAAVYTSPADDATGVALTGNIVWASVTGADGYYVYFSTDDAFTGVTPVDQTATSYAYSSDYDTRYYWKVVPYNVVGMPTEGIETWSFTTALSPFPAADLVFDGVRTVSQSMPMEPYYGYTITQNIYLQEELNIDGSAITSISYLYNKNSAWSETVEIYLKHTSRDTFADTYDWELDDFTHVYSGTMNVTTSEAIVTFDFNSPFIYNNTDNLVVLFFATQSGYHSNSDEFYNYPVAGNRSLTQRSDGTNYYTSFPGTIPSGTLKAYRAVSGFTFQELSLEPVFAVSADTLNFVDQIMGTESAVQNLTISNFGFATLSINSLSLTGTNADQFLLTDNNTYPASLEVSENIAVQVLYAPTTEGGHIAQLVITDDQNRAIYTVELVGNSIDTNIYASDLPWNESFEGDLLGWSTIIESSSTTASITLNNTTSNVQDGTAAIRFSNANDVAASLQLISPNLVPDLSGYRLRFWMKGDAGTDMILAKYDTDFTTLTVVDTFAVPLTYEQTVVEFEAALANERIVFLPVFATTYDYVYLDNITFEEIPEGPLAELSVSEIDFGDVPVLQSSSAQMVSITNVGFGTLNIGNIGIIGTDTALFAWDYVEETPDMALENGETLELTVTFTPDAVGAKVATLVINDDLGRRIVLNTNSKARNTNRNANEVALTGTGWLPPQGSTCTDPLPLTLPAVDVTGNTIDFVDDYSSTWISPSSSFLNGDDVVYQFTLANTMLLNGTITTTNSYIGAFILADEPNATTPAEVILSKTSSSTTLTYTNEIIPAGPYYLIISSYPSPQSIDYTINLTADALPAPAAATSPLPTDEAIDIPTSLTLAWTNANYTETIDLWLGVEGAREMQLVLDNVVAVNSYQATDLVPNATYNWKVINRNYSGETADTLVATWTFTTLGSAPIAVTYLDPADASTNRPLSGSLTWSTATGASGYNVYLSTDGTFTAVTPVDQATTTYAYSALDYETTYYWKVIPYNVVGQPTEGVLVWSFTTIPDPTIPMPITIDFEGTSSNPAAITLENFNIGTNQHNTTGNVMYKNIYSATTNGYIQFQAMNNITTTSMISFDYRVTAWSAGTAPVAFEAGHDYLVVNVSTDNGVSFSPIDQINSTNHVDSAEFATFTTDISAYADQSVIFRFEMEDDGVHDYWFDIDNIYFGEDELELVAPSNLQASSINGSINLTWSESLQQSRESRALQGYNVYRDSIQINEEVVTDTLFSDTDLEHGHTYNYYVTAVYDEGESDASNQVEVEAIYLFLSGEGTEANPYLIDNLTDLYILSQNNTYWAEGVYIEQTADIDASDTQNWDEGAGFSPIGNNINHFYGIYNGQGFTISELYIHRPNSTYIGLFGCTESADISNLGIVEAQLIGFEYIGGLVGYSSSSNFNNNHTTGDFSGLRNNTGGDRVGGLIGYCNDSNITNSQSNGNVNGTYSTGGLIGYLRYSTVTNSNATGNVNGLDHFVGGLVGYSYSSTISISLSTGNVVGRGSTGGIVGYSYYSNITDSFSTGIIAGRDSSGSTTESGGIGGFVGRSNYLIISNCYATGDVNGNGSYTGGLFGYCDSPTISNSFATGLVTGSGNYVGGLIGWRAGGSVISSFWGISTSNQPTSVGGTGLTTPEMQTLSTYIDAGWDFAEEAENGEEDIWTFVANDYPHLAWEGYETQLTSPPANLQANIVNGSVNLTWSAVDSQSQESRALQGYNVYRDSIQINDEVVLDTLFSDTNLVHGHSYSYYVTALYDEGESEASNVVEIEIYQLLVDFDASTTSTITGQEIQFNNLSTEGEADYYWEFGDGNSSLEENPIHVYQNAGLYTVSLTVSDEIGSVTGTKTDYIEVYYEMILLSEDFENNILDGLIRIETVGTFNSAPGIKNIANFGSQKAFGFGRSTQGSSAFDNYVTKLIIDFGNPTFVGQINFKEMELYGNWGSSGNIFVDGVLVPDTYIGRTPSNDGNSDSSYRQHSFIINQEVTELMIKIRDITSSSEIFIDDLSLLIRTSNIAANFYANYTEVDQFQEF